MVKCSRFVLPPVYGALPHSSLHPDNPSATQQAASCFFRKYPTHTHTHMLTTMPGHARWRLLEGICSATSGHKSLSLSSLPVAFTCCLLGHTAAVINSVLFSWRHHRFRSVMWIKRPLWGCFFKLGESHVAGIFWLLVFLALLLLSFPHRPWPPQQQTSCDRHASRASSSFSVACQRDSEVGQRYYILLVHFVFGGGGGSRHFSLCFRLISIPTISFLSSISSERFRWNADKYGASLLSVIGWIMTHKLSFTNFWMQKFIKLDCSKMTLDQNSNW